MDAVTAAPNNHRVLIENDRVRVLQVTTYPHQKENVHTHPWPSVVINPVECKNDWRYSDGKGHVLFDSRAAKEQWPYEVVQWRSGAEPPHTIENLGDSTCTFYRVELKSLTTAGHAGVWPASTDGPLAAPKNHKVIFENDYVRVLELFGAAHEKERPHVHPWPSVNLQVSPWFDFLNHGEGAEILFDSRTVKGITCPCAHWDEPAAVLRF
jgi:hypothetical protein